MRYYQPSSPTSSPPAAGSSLLPSAPNTPLPDNDTNNKKSFVEQMLMTRAIAIRMAGGDEVWDSLSEDVCNDYMDKATEELEKGNLIV